MRPKVITHDSNFAFSRLAVGANEAYATPYRPDGSDEVDDRGAKAPSPIVDDDGIGVRDVVEVLQQRVALRGPAAGKH